SDERCTKNVRDEILTLIENAPLDIYNIPRKNFFMGRWIKHSGWYPNFRQPQLFRNGKMTYDLKPVHEGFISHSVKEIGVINNIIWQFPFKNTEEVIHKANRYSTLGVEILKDKGETGGVFKAFLHGFWSFIKHYIFKLGFLDGGPGFVIAFGNFEGTFYRYIKLTEAQANWKTPSVKPIYKLQK
ncbi:MAG: glycosyltransferase family 2 protein, partial [Thiotrichales bacterium]|nr:glycosyltransferase family 2 protein [Thiotrichales bacterium]